MAISGCLALGWPHPSLGCSGLLVTGAGMAALTFGMQAIGALTLDSMAGSIMVSVTSGKATKAVIGMAEGCIIPAVGALVNAVFNACGVRVRELPITPDKILMGLAADKRG